MIFQIQETVLRKIRPKKFSYNNPMKRTEDFNEISFFT